MTDRPNWSATDKQRNFIKNLIEDREISAQVVDKTQLIIDTDEFTKVDATKVIQAFLEQPKRARVAAVPGPSVVPAETDPFDTLEVSRFAIPVTEVSANLQLLAGNSDLLFGEVREWRGHKFINVLKGAPGAFNRTRIKGREKYDLGRTLLVDQLKYTKMYGEHYRCCGCCGADLTDETSRALQLGPECRKRFGF